MPIEGFLQQSPEALAAPHQNLIRRSTRSRRTGIAKVFPQPAFHTPLLEGLSRYSCRCGANPSLPQGFAHRKGYSRARYEAV